LRSPYERIVIDSSVLLGANSPQIVAGAALGYYRAYWSSWIVSEYVRNRIEWAVTRPSWIQASKSERTGKLEYVRSRVNSATDYLSRVLISVDYHTAPVVDLSWLDDSDDHPIMQTALAADADALVTDNTKDFSSGERRNGVLLLDSRRFLKRLYDAIPESEDRIREYLASG
jgi:hypothetical protein